MTISTLGTRTSASSTRRIHNRSVVLRNIMFLLHPRFRRLYEVRGTGASLLDHLKVDLPNPTLDIDI
jgi:hypothetical protein